MFFVVQLLNDGICRVAALIMLSSADNGREAPAVSSVCLLIRIVQRVLLYCTYLLSLQLFILTPDIELMFPFDAAS